MTVRTSLDDLYLGKINVWVEDVLTREYLGRVWGATDVKFFIAGNNDAISGVVADARANELANVFGVVDRDFGVSNVAEWNDLAKKKLRFILDVHEIENYLLDAIALAETSINTKKRNHDEIKRQMKEKARQLTWWMACRRVLWQIRSMCLTDFPAHPKADDISDLESAKAYIETTPKQEKKQPWYRRFAVNASQILEEENVEAWLIEAHKQYAQDVESGEWCKSFSGKDIFRDVREFIYQPPRRASSVQHDVDVAKTIAAWQIENEGVPSDLVSLLKALRARVASPDASTSNAKMSGPNS